MIATQSLAFILIGRPGLRCMDSDFASLKTIEREYEELLKTAGYEDANFNRCRINLLTQLRACLLQHPIQCHHDNLDGYYWRLCFHRPIDYYRKFIRGSEALKSAEGRWALCELDRIITSGLAYWTCLMHAFMVRHPIASNQEINVDISILEDIFAEVNLPIISGASQGAPNDANAMVAILYHGLIFCGDLARYRCQFDRNFNAADKYRLAWRFYYGAYRLCPTHGHAANQLATVIAHWEQPGGVLFWYLRAQHCQVPFAAAKSNMAAFCDNVLLADENKYSSWKSVAKTISCLYKGNLKDVNVEVNGLKSDSAYLLMVFLSLEILYPQSRSILEKVSDTLFQAIKVEENNGKPINLIAKMKYAELRGKSLKSLQESLIITTDVKQMICDLQGYSLLDDLVTKLLNIPEESPVIIAENPANTMVSNACINTDEVILFHGLNGEP